MNTTLHMFRLNSSLAVSVLVSLYNLTASPNYVLVRMASEVDTELLISLVEVWPVLWDKSVEKYDREETRKAWKEVCVGLKT